MKECTKKEIRDAAKFLGYSVSFKANQLNDSLVNVGFNYVVKGKKSTTLGANAFSVDFVADHKPIFNLLSSYDGAFLTDSEQKIVF
jgi:hypothetical protein